MIKKYIFLATICLSTFIVRASNPIDSIGVENINGKKVIIHKVDPKESYYSISRKYNVNVKDVISYNENKNLQIGTIVKVPTELAFNAVTKNTGKSAENAGFFEHTVIAKDNLNMLAEKYGTTINEIKQLNNLTSSNLQIGQVLKIPFVKTNNVAANVPVENNTVTPTVKEAQQGSVIEHTVKAKETLNLLSGLYGTTVEDIKRLNNLSSSNLQIGQVLKIQNNKDESVANNPAPAEKVKNTIEKAANTIESKTDEPSFNYTVKDNETIYNIAARYNLTTYQLIQFNKLTSYNLKPGQTLKIPGNKEAVAEVEKTQPAPVQKKVETENTAVTKPISTNEKSFEHTVKAGETIYAIASKYGLTTYQLKQANNLTDNELKVGQKLIIKGDKIVNATNSNEENDETDSSPSTMITPALKRSAATYGLNQVEEKGTGIWIADPDLDPAKMLILHKTAPVGTIIKITNPMTNRSTFAKVVGKFTENETTKDVIIVMTKAVADAVGALDKRFFCHLTYGPQDNDQ
ncbi:LysM peptidoglycan-binding domain-containing protein [Pedobacter montanisoli]|uniref:LysM peptidoglycan-binding domain-containing protein n=1 Tax=Pedobacter montanisoli TaxID=2923277 RepID=A0ABS9ZXP8_9SPHI|nr:LysM peptidoglycan-binding domain-containing protein [Pedobacter montanisoli]MCJ0743055.1 LysM peptidoglycan-binding domain-containing protein [Pedobacter montanisoli]